MYTQVDILQCRGRAALRWKAEKGDCYWEGSRSKRYSLQFHETCPEELQIKNVCIYFWRAEKNVDQAPLIFKKKNKLHIEAR